MQIARLHSWDVDPREARTMQESLAGRVDVRTPLGPYETIAAADVSFNKFGRWLYAAVVVVRAGTFEVVERVGVTAEARFPYVPGLLSFREAPSEHPHHGEAGLWTLPKNPGKLPLPDSE